MKSEYSTRQRTAIIEFLKENSAHVSASDIMTRLSEQGIKIGAATVYRTLDRLCEQGLVKRFVIDERSGACYQYARGAECAEHFHLKCIKCGALIHMDCGFLKEMEEHILKDHGFTVSSGKTVIYGLCSDCGKNHESAHSSCSHFCSRKH